MADVISRAAQFRHRGTIQNYVLNQDGSTGEVYFDDSSWATSAETWVDAQPLSGRDYVTAQQAGYVATHRVSLRYRPGIRVQYTRFIVKGVKLYVVHVADVENRNIRLECLCRSVEPVV